MTNPQGTEWETSIVEMLRLNGHEADRYPKRAQANEPDIWAGSARLSTGMPVVFWKRLVGTKKDGRRKPDGERWVVIIGIPEFLWLLNVAKAAGQPADLKIQAKWTANLNVTKTLGGLRAWLKQARLELDP